MNKNKTFYDLGEYNSNLKGIGLFYPKDEKNSSNVYILEESKTLIDLGNEKGLVERILKHYPKIEIKKVILTHAHLDHIGGLKEILSKWQPEIFIHLAELDYELEKNISLKDFFYKIGIKKLTLLRGNENIELDEGDLRVLYTPGHTPGSICLYDPQRRILFSGDTCFSTSKDKPFPLACDPERGNLEELSESIRMLLYLNIEAVLPGHLFPYWERVKEHLKKIYFELQLDLQETEEMALINMGILTADLGEINEAIELFDRVLAKDPFHPGACFTKALACYQTGKFSLALELLDRALKVVPDFKEAQDMRRMVLIALSTKSNNSI